MSEGFVSKRLNKISEILILLSIFVSVILLMVRLGHGQELNYTDKVGSLNYFLSSTLLSCNILFDTGNTTDKHVILCEHIFNYLDNKCKNTYFEFCFGKQ